MINYHGHTKRCQHACGEDEEYVLKALEAGYSGIGFSDHVMLPYVKKENGIRAPFSMKEDYLHSIRNLQKKYANQIDIYLGFECEWDDSFFDYYQFLLQSKQVDYLIFGNHFLEFSNGEFHNFIGSEEDYLQKYKTYAIKALNSGLFKIMAHPDYFMSKVTSFSTKCKEISYEICQAAKANHVALEINCGAANANYKKMYKDGYHYPYPSYDFFLIAKEIENILVIGLDVHHPNSYVENAKNEIIQFAQSLNLPITDDLLIRKKE